MRLTLLAALGVGLVACGGAGVAGQAAPADGPPPSGKAQQRALVLVEGESEATAAEAPPGDGTTTPEIVRSVEKDQP
jgi:DMSO/TMAO reductase YedYZ molybdopterin-dependent catalytic subunit